MARQNQSAATVEELVALAITAHDKERKYKLYIVTRTEYVDAEAGRAFEAECYKRRDYADAFGWDTERAVKNLGRTLGHEPTTDDIAQYVLTLPEGDGLRESLVMSVEDRQARHAVEQTNYRQWYDDHQPARQDNHYYSLDSARGDRYSASTIDIGPELGVQLVSIWKFRPRYKGDSQGEPSGYVTLAGILKRLGKTDIKEQIDLAEKKVREEREKSARNYTRRQINELLAKIEALVVKDGAAIGVTTEMFNLSVELSNKLEAEA